MRGLSRLQVAALIVGGILLLAVLSGGNKTTTSSTVPTTAPTATPMAAPPAPAASTGQPKWFLVAQFKGSDDRTTTRVFTIRPSPNPWRVTWLTYFALSIEVVEAKLGLVIERASAVQSPGPPRIGDFRVCCPGDYYIRINAVGAYQIDVEELRS